MQERWASKVVFNLIDLIQPNLFKVFTEKSFSLYFFLHNFLPNLPDLNFIFLLKKCHLTKFVYFFSNNFFIFFNLILTPLVLN